MPQAIECDLLLYADDSVLLFTHKYVDVINDQLNRDFNSVCERFVDSRLSIHLGRGQNKVYSFH